MRKKILLFLFIIAACFLFAAIKVNAFPIFSSNAESCFKLEKNSTKSSGILSSLYLSPQSSFIYYSQTDPEWKDYLYGGRDPLSKYGCGPTVLAMLVSNLTSQTVTPVDMADWAAEHGYWSAGGGSRHNLIPEGAIAFGLKAESLSIRSPEALKLPLYYNKLIVLLMGPGHFTQRGHFIILTGVTDNGNITVADPFNPSNNAVSWPLELLLDELSSRSTAGGPVWVISASAKMEQES